MHIVALLMCAIGVASATPIAQAWVAAPPDPVQQELWTRQMFIFELFDKLHQPDADLSAHLRRLASDCTWTIDGNFGAESAAILADFAHQRETGIYIRPSVFTFMDDSQAAAARSLVRLLYYAADWTTFQQVAVYARLNVNPDMFAYAMHCAVLNKFDMNNRIVVPAWHEIMPHRFYAAEVIEQARHIRRMQTPANASAVAEHTIRVPRPATDDPEARLAYFTEDAYLSELYLLPHLAGLPFRLNASEFESAQSIGIGLMYLYITQMLLARYHLERLSNGLGAVEADDLDMARPIEHGYNSRLAYANGEPLPVRAAHANLSHSGVELFNVMLERIDDVVDSGRVQLANGSSAPLLDVDTLGNLMQANPESLNALFYRSAEMLGRHLLAAGSRPAGGLPGVLEHYEMSLRDPMFYRLFAKLMRPVHRYLDRQPAYTKRQLLNDNVRIAEVSFDRRLTTSFERYNASVLGVRSEQRRLQHDHFAIRMRMETKKATHATILLYLGPKVDEQQRVYPLNELRKHMYHIGSIFGVVLKAGENVIERSFAEFGMSAERRSFADMYAEARRGAMGDAESSWPLEQGPLFPIPKRMGLPRGRRNGLPVQFFVFVEPVEIMMDDLNSISYPFDRPINATEWFQPNMYWLDAMIYHRGEELF